MPINKNTGQFAQYLYHLDTEQFSTHRITSAFCYWDGETAILMDIGTSDNIIAILRTLKKNNIPMEKLRAILLTHYHFDHAGGATKLWKKIHPKNPQFRIMTTQATMEKLQNAESHVTGARTTFGEFVGNMNPIPEELVADAYEIIETEVDLPLPLRDDYRIRLLKTPGHSPDHVSPLVFHGERPVFLFCGEAAGTLYHSTKMLSAPTSMPPNFKQERYILSLKKLASISPEIIGFCHFGMVTGIDDCRDYFRQHEQFVVDFRDKIIELYREDPSTRHIIEGMQNTPFHMSQRVDADHSKAPVTQKMFENLQIALTFGVLVDLGYRKAKYEQKKALLGE